GILRDWLSVAGNTIDPATMNAVIPEGPSAGISMANRLAYGEDEGRDIQFDYLMSGGYLSETSAGTGSDDIHEMPEFLCELIKRAFTRKELIKDVDRQHQFLTNLPASFLSGLEQNKLASYFEGGVPVDASVLKRALSDRARIDTHMKRKLCTLSFDRVRCLVTTDALAALFFTASFAGINASSVKLPKDIGDNIASYLLPVNMTPAYYRQIQKDQAVGRRMQLMDAFEFRQASLFKSVWNMMGAVFAADEPQVDKRQTKFLTAINSDVSPEAALGMAWCEARMFVEDPALLGDGPKATAYKGKLLPYRNLPSSLLFKASAGAEETKGEDDEAAEVRPASPPCATGAVRGGAGGAP
ncbi:MAG TPA: hypothetical protein QF353_02495, partial [Gammaproteobacteria bacterium]|nr:hypothetical protein [Gammaproteobacteria bacterium]